MYGLRISVHFDTGANKREPKRMSWVSDSQIISKWAAVESKADEVSYKGLPASMFLEGVETLATMFDLLPGVNLAKISMMDHVTKIKAHIMSDTQKTLKDMVDQELASQTEKQVYADQKSVCHQLTWLVRAIAFLVGIVEELQDDASKEMVAAVSASYEKSLKPFHNFVIRNTILVAAKAAPARAKFLKRLDENDANILQTMKSTVTIINKCNKCHAELVHMFAPLPK